MERDRLIAEIAKETGIRIDPADPLLAAATINRILLDEALAELQRAVRTSGNEVSAACLQQIEAAKAAAAGADHGCRGVVGGTAQRGRGRGK
jgi:hypothetical protein